MVQQIRIPEKIRRLMTVMEQAGFEICAVGGCVRDSLLGLEPSDWDLCTSALPEETIARFSVCGCRTLPTGIRHGTVTVLWEREPVELTTYRVDGDYSDCRRPDEVTFTRTLTEDLGRRDFTVNAMACRSDGIVIDLFGGRDDLAAGIIRCVGDPKKRFTEDALRILRALRFAARLGFVLEADTGEAANALRERLHMIAPERIWKELSGLLTGNFSGRICKDYISVLETVLNQKLSQNTVEKLDQLENDTVTRLAWLLFSTGERDADHLEQIGRETALMLRTDKKTRTLLSSLLAMSVLPLPDRLVDARRLAGTLGGDLCLKLCSIRRLAGELEEHCTLLEQVVRENHCVTIGQLAVTGEMLRGIGFSAGPALGKILQMLLELVMEDVLPNERDVLLSYIREHGYV